MRIKTPCANQCKRHEVQCSMLSRVHVASSALSHFVFWAMHGGGWRGGGGGVDCTANPSDAQQYSACPFSQHWSPVQAPVQVGTKLQIQYTDVVMIIEKHGKMLFSSFKIDAYNMPPLEETYSLFFFFFFAAHRRIWALSYKSKHLYSLVTRTQNNIFVNSLPFFFCFVVHSNHTKIATSYISRSLWQTPPKESVLDSNGRLRCSYSFSLYDCSRAWSSLIPQLQGSGCLSRSHATAPAENLSSDIHSLTGAVKEKKRKKVNWVLASFMGLPWYVTLAALLPWATKVGCEEKWQKDGPHSSIDQLVMFGSGLFDSGGQGRAA